MTTNTDRKFSAPPREIESTWDVAPKHFGLSCLGTNLVAQYVLLATTGSFNFGFSLAALNTSKRWICYDFKWCLNEAGQTIAGCDNDKWYGSLASVGVFIGAAFGCLIGAKLSTFGRRGCMLIMHGVFILGAVLSASADGFASLLIARIVVGLAVGISTVCVPMLISEMTPKQSRGFYCVFHQLLITVGILFAIVLGLPFGEPPAASVPVDLSTFNAVWWRVLVGCPIVVCIPATVMFLTVYTTDTPHYLYETGQVHTGEALLQAIYRKQDVSHEIKEIKDSLADARVLRNESLSVWSALGDSTYRHVIILGCVLSIGQQVTGINVLMSNSNKLYEAAGLEKEATILSTCMTALNVLMTFPPIFFVDKLGRRTLMLIGCCGQALSLAPAMIVNIIDHKMDAAKYISVASTYCYVVFFAVAYGPVLWVYLHEIFPIEIKQGAAGLASSLNWIATIAMVLPSDHLLTGDPTVIFSIFTVMGVIAWAVVFFFMKETKGLSIDESPYFRNKQRRVPKSMSIMAQNTGREGSQMAVGIGFDSVETAAISKQHINDRKATSDLETV